MFSEQVVTASWQGLGRGSCIKLRQSLYGSFAIVAFSFAFEDFSICLMLTRQHWLQHIFLEVKAVLASP